MSITYKLNGDYTNSSPTTCKQSIPWVIPKHNITSINSDRFCEDNVLVDPNDEGVSINQSLTGKANPRTKIPPIIISRPYDFDYWKDTPISTISIMNKKQKKYPKMAGYSNEDELVDMECIGCDVREEIPSDIKASPLIQTIQPGVYTLPNDYEPINSSIGISYPPQFEKIKESNIEGTGNILFSDRYDGIYLEQPKHNDSKLIEAYTPINTPINGEPINPITTIDNQIPNVYNVYDPRFSGYGSDDRNYLDPLLHQQRYYYDDIDSIRRPNYIVRSKIDSCVTSFGDTYGPMQNSSYTLNQLRPLAEKSYLQNNLDYRNDLMESLLRKRNAEMWQMRQAPKYTQKQPSNYR